MHRYKLKELLKQKEKVNRIRFFATKMNQPNRQITKIQCTLRGHPQSIDIQSFSEFIHKGTVGRVQGEGDLYGTLALILLQSFVFLNLTTTKMYLKKFGQKIFRLFDIFIGKQSFHCIASIKYSFSLLFLFLAKYCDKSGLVVVTNKVLFSTLVVFLVAKMSANNAKFLS